MLPINRIAPESGDFKEGQVLNLMTHHNSFVGFHIFYRAKRRVDGKGWIYASYYGGPNNTDSSNMSDYYSNHFGYQRLLSYYGGVCGGCCYPLVYWPNGYYGCWYALGIN